MSETIHGKDPSDPHGEKRAKEQLAELKQIRVELSELRGIAKQAEVDSASAKQTADGLQRRLEIATWLGGIGTLLGAIAAIIALFK